MTALPVLHVPLTKPRGVFKPCRWCLGVSGRIDEAPLIEPARHAGRMICEGCGRQTGWVSARALRKAVSLSPAVPTAMAKAGIGSSPVSATNTPDPHTPGAADGQRSIHSDPAAGAKTDGCQAIDGQGGPVPEVPYRDGSQAVTNHEGIAS